MADLDRDLRGMDAFKALADGSRAEGTAPDAEAPNIIDMLIVSSGGVLSASIAVLGIWKFVELLG